MLINGTQTSDDYGWDFSPTYNGIIIRAIAIAPGYIPSNVITKSYIFDPVNSTLPVVSIAIDPDDMFNPNTGMHVRVIRFIHGTHIMDQIFGMTGRKRFILNFTNQVAI